MDCLSSIQGSGRENIPSIEGISDVVLVETNDSVRNIFSRWFKCLEYSVSSFGSYMRGFNYLKSFLGRNSIPKFIMANLGNRCFDFNKEIIFISGNIRSGVDFYFAVRSLEGLSDIPFIFSSGYNDVVNVAEELSKKNKDLFVYGFEKPGIQRDFNSLIERIELDRNSYS